MEKRREEIERMEIHIDNRERDLILKMQMNCLTFDVKTLDSYNYDNVGMMKIDVQGYEPWVLDGAKSTILRNRPTIFIEVEEAQLHVYNFTSQDIFTRLDHLGYKYWKLIDAPHLVDYVAVPLW